MLPAKTPPSQAETNRHPKNHFCRKHQCVRSCKTHIALNIKQNTTKKYGFQSFDWRFQHKRLPYRKVHIPVKTLCLR